MVQDLTNDFGGWPRVLAIFNHNNKLHPVCAFLSAIYSLLVSGHFTSGPSLSPRVGKINWRFICYPHPHRMSCDVLTNPSRGTAKVNKLGGRCHPKVSLLNINIGMIF